MKKIISIALMLIVLMHAGSAYANVCNWAESKNWAVSAPGKLTRGIINVGLGWTNIFIQPFREDNVMSGIGLGLSNFAVRTVQGIGEILLFWLPPAPEETLHECAFYDWGMIERE